MSENKKNSKSAVVLYFVAAAVAIALLGISAYRPDETGVWSFDIRWIADTIYETHTALIGLLVSGVFIWALPLDWADAKDNSLPVAVRALSPIALSIVLWAILGAIGRM